VHNACTFSIYHVFIPGAQQLYPAKPSRGSIQLSSFTTCSSSQYSSDLTTMTSTNGASNGTTDGPKKDLHVLIIGAGTHTIYLQTTCTHP
jgi:hypothetical protein